MRFRRALAGVALFIGLLWIIELLDTWVDLHLSRLGVYPRAWHGLWGVLCAPMIHGSWQHLISNSIALLVLGVVLLYGYLAVCPGQLPLRRKRIGAWPDVLRLRQRNPAP
jgi:membrane associated rhomboid family serine protease